MAWDSTSPLRKRCFFWIETGTPRPTRSASSRVRRQGACAQAGRDGVVVVTPCVAGSVEEKVLARQSKKRDLFRAAVGGGGAGGEDEDADDYGVNGDEGGDADVDGDGEGSHLLSWDAIRKVYALEGYTLSQNAPTSTSSSTSSSSSTATASTFHALTPHAHALTEVAGALPPAAGSRAIENEKVRAHYVARGTVRRAAAQD